MATATRQLHAAVVRRMEMLIAARAPALPAPARARSAEVSVQFFRALLPLVLAARADEREAVIAELKKVLRGYLASALGAVAGT